MAFVNALHQALVIGVKIDEVFLGVFVEVDLIYGRTLGDPHLHVELVEGVRVLRNL